MNVLLTCAGRRTQMVEFLRESVDGIVVATDVDPDAPALAVADVSATTPGVDDPTYVDALVEICSRHDARLVIPCLEPELPLLAQARVAFRTVGAEVLVSTADVIELCYDKLATNDWLRRLGEPVPQTHATLRDARAALASGRLRYPVLLKPRWGTTSFGVELAYDDEELNLVHQLLDKRLTRDPIAGPERHQPGRNLLVQERLPGTEYGLDVLNDLTGNYMCTVVKRKLRMRAGQTDRAVTVADPALERLGAALGTGLRHIGLLDCDVIVTDRGPVVIDLNPRFGGGYPFTHVAGTNLLGLLLGPARDDRTCGRPRPPKPGVVMAKRDEVVVVHRSANR